MQRSTLILAEITAELRNRSIGFSDDSMDVDKYHTPPQSPSGSGQHNIFDDTIAKHCRPVSDALNESIDLDSMERYRELVEHTALLNKIRSPAKQEESSDKTLHLLTAQSQQNIISAELGSRLINDLAESQRRRQYEVDLTLKRKSDIREWQAFDARLRARGQFNQGIDDQRSRKHASGIDQLIKREEEFRRRLRIPAFGRVFFKIEEKLFPELDEEALSLVRRAWDKSLRADEVFADDFNIKITRADLLTLSKLNWLNDEVINFYLNLIARRSEKDTSLPKSFAHSTFFYENLCSRGFAGVKRWTRKVDLFSFDVILIPIHLGNHWCLAVIDMKRKEINYFDSLGGQNQQCLQLLRNYISEEHQDKKGSPLDLSGWVFECRRDIPYQMNGSDCGVFTCCFAEFSSRRDEMKFDQRIMPYFRQRMVYEIRQKQLMI